MRPTSKVRWKGRYRQASTPLEYLEQRCDMVGQGCWNWNKGVDKDGYGQCHAAKVAKEVGVTRAHQLSWVAYYGVIPDGMLVCHKCDNPACVNPSHLFLGTPNDNVQDMMTKGRYIHPSTLGLNCKLSKENKKDIYNMKNKGLTSQQVGNKFGVSFSRVCQIWRGE